MLNIYASDQKGYSHSGAPKFVPDLPEYTAATRKVLGDAQGNFVFDEVADGDFYVITMITWVVGYRQQGGTLMQSVKVEGGETARVVLSP